MMTSVLHYNVEKVAVRQPFGIIGDDASVNSTHKIPGNWLIIGEDVYNGTHGKRVV